MDGAFMIGWGKYMHKMLFLLNSPNQIHMQFTEYVEVWSVQI